MTESLVAGALAATSIGLCAWLFTSGRFDARQGGIAAQVAIATVCGLTGALVAAVPYVDTVPDTVEGPALVAGVLVLIAALIAGSSQLRRRLARTERQTRPPRAPRVSLVFGTCVRCGRPLDPPAPTESDGSTPPADPRCTSCCATDPVEPGPTLRLPRRPSTRGRGAARLP